MLIKEKNNRGFTLVEVIVSILVLSITIVSVLSAFTLAAKSNSKTKRTQAAESLLEDFVEYTDAYSKELDPEQSMVALRSSKGLYAPFGGSVSVETPFAESNDVEVSMINGVTEGVNRFNVRITRDRNPSEYGDATSKSGANESGIISFGETGSKTVLIDANVSSYDEKYLEFFWDEQKKTVESHNLAEDNKKAEAEAVGTTYTPQYWELFTKEEMKSKVTREIWIEMTHPERSPSVYDYEKVQLTGSVIYKVDAGVHLPDGASYIRSELFFVSSEEYDSLTSTVTTPQLIKQIYILYSPSADMMGMATTSDLRLLDKTKNAPGTSGGSLDANVFLVYQKSTAENVASMINKTLKDHYISSDNIRLSFKPHAEDETKSSAIDPTRAEVYCSANVTVVEGTPTSVKETDYQLVPTNDDLRVVTVKIEIIDPETNQVVTATKEPIACLQ